MHKPLVEADRPCARPGDDPEHQDAERDAYGSGSADAEVIEFTWQQMVQMTKNFSPANKIGSGNFGDVFRAVMAGGAKFAVKVIKVSDESQGAASNGKYSGAA